MTDRPEAEAELETAPAAEKRPWQTPRIESAPIKEITAGGMMVGGDAMALSMMMS